MINTAEEQEYIDRVKEAYELYDKRYDAYQEASWAERHIKPGYIRKNDALYYIWLISKLQKRISDLEWAIHSVRESIVENPRCDAEMWTNDGKKLSLDMINEYLESQEKSSESEDGQQT